MEAKSFLGQDKLLKTLPLLALLPHLPLRKIIIMRALLMDLAADFRQQTPPIQPIIQPLFLGVQLYSTEMEE
jgi:hypothetical protein